MFENRFHEFIHRGREIRGRLVVRAVTCSRSEKSIALPARVHVRAYVAFVKPGGGRVHSNYSILTHDARKPRVRRFRFYKTLCIIRPSTLFYTHTHVEKIIGTVYANERATIVRIYVRERKKIVKMNRLVSNRISFVLATGR